MKRTLIVLILGILLVTIYYFVRDYEILFGALATGLLYSIHQDK